jgi:hypothetical protein
MMKLYDANKAATNKWLEAKKALIDSNKYPWLGFSAPNWGVDELIYNALHPIVDSPYDAYQIEALISSAGMLLDRCVVYRQQMYDLEVAGVKWALDYQLYSDLKGDLQVIELAKWIEEQHKEEKQGQQDAKTAFQGGAGQPLPDGFAALANKNFDALGKAITGETDRKKAVDGKWKTMDAYQLVLQDRHTTPGSAFNYWERYQNIGVFLEQDVKIAYKKIISINSVLKEIYGIDPVFDTPSRANYINYVGYLIGYLRKMIDDIEIATKDEVEFDHIVYLHQWRHLGGAGNYQRITDVAWGTLMAGQGLIAVDLTDEFKDVFDGRIRVRAIGLSMSTDDPGNPTTRAKRAIAAVFPPPSSDGKPRAPIVMEEIGVTIPGNVKLVSCSQVMNIDPRGPWKIQLSANFGWADNAPHARIGADPLDIKLHLRLRTFLKRDFHAWGALGW